MTIMSIITANWSVPNAVTALTTTRYGGVSKQPFNSLNLGMHVDDTPSDVIENRRRLKSHLNLPGDPIWLNQTHSTKIFRLIESSQTINSECDGVITRHKGVVCAVMTADCLPLFLSRRDGCEVAVLHVGWRGLAQGIIEKGVAMFDCPATDLVGWAGPSISMRHFEIGLEVKEQLGGSETAYSEPHGLNKCYANMYELTRERLENCGMTEFTHSNYCTFEDSELFFSFRRSQITGRMASLIWIS